jgi:hypothetical protein
LIGVQVVGGPVGEGARTRAKVQGHGRRCKDTHRADRQRLARLAEQSSTGGRKVSPMQIGAQILEDALSGIPVTY